MRRMILLRRMASGLGTYWADSRALLHSRGIRTGVEIPRGPAVFKIAGSSCGYRAVTCSNGQTEMRASGDPPAQVIAFALVP